MQLTPFEPTVEGIWFLEFFSYRPPLVSDSDCSMLEQGCMKLSSAVPWRPSTPVSASVRLQWWGLSLHIPFATAGQQGQLSKAALIIQQEISGSIKQCPGLSDAQNWTKSPPNYKAGKIQRQNNSNSRIKKSWFIEMCMIFYFFLKTRNLPAFLHLLWWGATISSFWRIGRQKDDGALGFRKLRSACFFNQMINQEDIWQINHSLQP